MFVRRESPIPNVLNKSSLNWIRDFQFRMEDEGMSPGMQLLMLQHAVDEMPAWE